MRSQHHKAVLETAGNTHTIRSNSHTQGQVIVTSQPEHAFFRLWYGKPTQHHNPFLL